VAKIAEKLQNADKLSKTTQTNCQKRLLTNENCGKIAKRRQIVKNGVRRTGVFDELGSSTNWSSTNWSSTNWSSTNWGVRRTGVRRSVHFHQFDELEFDELSFDELGFDELRLYPKFKAHFLT
jgi:hypothetical protein